MRLFVEQMVLKSPRLWLTSIMTKTTAWASWCSFNERCLSEDHICKLLYKITVFREFIKQPLVWNGWSVPISAAQNRHLFELKGEKNPNPKYLTRSFFSAFLKNCFSCLWQAALCSYTTSSIDSRQKCWYTSFKMNFSFGLIELIWAWQVAYLANWVDSKIKPFSVARHPKKASCWPL